MTKGLRKRALDRLFGRHSGGDAHSSTLGRIAATHDLLPQDTGRGDAPPDVETLVDPTQHAEMPPSSPPHADVLEERRYEPHSAAVEAAPLPPDSITDQLKLKQQGGTAMRPAVTNRILTSWSPNYADEVKKAQNRDLAEKLHAKVQEQLSQTQVDSNTPTRLSREEEDSIIETVIGPSRKNRYRWRGSEHRPYESSTSTYESAAPPGCSSSQDPTMEQRMKAMEDWQSRRESELLQMAEEERRRREQRELEFTQFISTLPSDAQEAYRRRFLADQAGTSRQGGVGDEDDDDRD
ncbi:uncharacterized protein LOC109847625 [Asparagus officinalis]|uniref:uncharacterized protein LOC109847625 n=1 Tax=Asparagus officinalis TaxID=4686 RepID=UPI00098E3BBE|nr:uncharacterized protein LOC109847625 [Asparagus officinalis]